MRAGEPRRANGVRGFQGAIADVVEDAQPLGREEPSAIGARAEFSGGAAGIPRRLAPGAFRISALTEMDIESREGSEIPSGAQYVASRSGEVYYPSSHPFWRQLDPADRWWFQNERAARVAGFRPALPAPPGLEDFELIEKLGHGGTSTVYRARDLILGRDVAVKVMHRSDCTDEESLARFAREARLVARLQHPGVVSVFAVKRLPSGGLALVMEYIPGRTLRDLIAEGPLSVERAERILHDVGQALAAAHEQGIVHRDVKPQNIFLREGTGQALLADFGIAIPLNEANRITHAGSVIGTPAYMAPEQFDGADPDGRSDLYSLGLVGWELLTGVSPWEGESLYGIIRKQKEVQLPSLRKLRPEVPARVRVAIEGALEKHPQARWQDVPTFLSHLAGESGRFPRVSAALERLRRRFGGGAPPSVAVGAGLSYLADAPTVRFNPSGEGAAAVATAIPEAPEASGRRRRAAAVLLMAAGIAAAGVMLNRQQEAGAEPDRSGGAVAEQSSNVPLVARRVEPAPAVIPGFESDPADAAASDPADEADLVDPPTDSLPSDLATDSAPAPSEEAPSPLAVDAPATEGENAASQPEPEEAPPAPRLAVDRTTWRIAAGGLHSCGFDEGDRLRCWGSDERGQMGGGGGPRSSVPTQLPIGSRVRSVVAGGFHSCALDANGFAYCWGDNREGQLGTGSREADAGPVRVADQRFLSLSIGFSHSCGIGRDRNAYCWGSDTHGQLGSGRAVSVSRPTHVPTAGSFVMIAAGWNHTCALTTQGSAHCWGQNASGQLGDGSAVSKSLPVPVVGDLAFRAITAGSAHTCALTTEGEAYCWGQNADGRLGDGNSSDRYAPVRVRTPLRFVQISAGGRHSCAVSSDGGAYCWGQNNYGQLGDGSTTPRSAPIRVRSDVLFTSIVAGGSHTCAVSTSGTQHCWGYNVEGQLGDGTLVHRTVPQRVEPAPAP